jgi:hypothetical protein
VRDAYVREIREANISPWSDMDANLLRDYGRLCARAVAKGRSARDFANIAGYMGSSEMFDEAVTEFAVEYADQNERD